MSVLGFPFGKCDWFLIASAFFRIGLVLELRSSRLGGQRVRIVRANKGSQYFIEHESVIH